MPNRKNKFQLIDLPWWLNIAIAGFAFSLLRYAVPNVDFGNPFYQRLSKLSEPVAIVVAFVFGLSAIRSLLTRSMKKRLLRIQTGIETLRKLNWRQFESLVGEAYNSLGYSVVENAYAGPDGGVDLEIKKDGKTYIVQCKNWKLDKVGIKIVREMLGIQVAGNYDGVIIVSSGKYTKAAMDYAKNNSIQMIDGPGLLTLIQQIKEGRKASEIEKTHKKIMPTCPVCSAEMVLRRARKGRYQGHLFWGCANFPDCRGIVSYETGEKNILKEMQEAQTDSVKTELN